MNPGAQFEVMIPDGDVYRVIYTDHFVRRFEFDEPNHPAVKRTVSEVIVRAKIEEAIPKIDEVVYGKSLKGVIVSQTERFIMLFDAVETTRGRQLQMITMSSRVDFQAKSAKEVLIKVNPEFNVIFSSPLSFALKVSILADLALNWSTIQPGTLYHLGGELMDYWLERAANTFHVPMADWAMDLMEIEVS
jgi:hypothetical protein